jgi:hypothetical protein
MNIPISDEEFPDLLRMQGTSPEESAKKVVNDMMRDISQQGADLGHKKMWWQVTRFSLDKDMALAHVISIEEPLELSWYIHKALLTCQAL